MIYFSPRKWLAVLVDRISIRPDSKHTLTRCPIPPLTQVFGLFLLTSAHLLLGQTQDLPTSIVGKWTGRLPESVGSLKVVLHVEGEKGSLRASLDSPDQNTQGIPIDSITYQEGASAQDNVFFTSKKINANFTGRYFPEEKEIRGLFTQNNVALQLNLKPVEVLESKIPKALGFFLGNQLPSDFRSSGGEGALNLHLINRSSDFVCLGLINRDGNLVHGWADGKPGQPVFYVSPGGRTHPDFPYKLTVGDAFVILTLTGKIVGYGKPVEAGTFDLVLEGY